MNPEWEQFFQPNTAVLALPSWGNPKLILKADSLAQRWNASALYPAFRILAKGFRLAMRLRACVGWGIRQTEGPWSLEPLLKDLGVNWSTNAVLMGTLGPAQKITIQLSQYRQVRAYAKFGQTPAAQARLEQEYLVLKALPPGIAPKALALQDICSGKLLVISAIAGNTLPAHLPVPQLVRDFLLKLPRGKSFGICEHPWVKPLLPDPRASAWLQSLKEREWPIVPLHGDFAPWNLIRQNGQISAIDWEYGSPDGLPGVDLAHYVLQVSALVMRSPPAKARENAIQTLLQTPQLGLSYIQAQNIVFLAALDACNKALADGQSPQEPLQRWRKQIWEGA